VGRIFNGGRADVPTSPQKRAWRVGTGPSAHGSYGGSPSSSSWKRLRTLGLDQGREWDLQRVFDFRPAGDVQVSQVAWADAASAGVVSLGMSA